MAKRIQYNFIYTAQRVAKPGRLASIDARQFRTDAGYKIERDGDTVYVSRDGYTVEIPWVQLVSAVRVGDAKPQTVARKGVTNPKQSDPPKTKPHEAADGLGSHGTPEVPGIKL